VEDIGGGVCQVVTTLYNAVLRAELQVTQRHNHSARVSYAPPGFDATVAGDYFDLKFKNTTPRPLLITAHVRGSALFVGIYGYEERKEGRSIRFEAVEIEALQPEPCEEIEDETLLPGERVVQIEPQPGYRVQLIKHVYLDGNPVEQIVINTSTYKALPGVIAIGPVE
jgi:vancomycin resistance protein YoaR